MDQSSVVVIPAKRSASRDLERKFSALFFNFLTFQTLISRELLKLFSSPSRIVGVVAQPFLFWFVLGSGFASSFSLSDNSAVNYQTYFFPGILALVILFASIFSTITLIEDKEAGLLQTFLVGPGSRTSLVLGKITGVMLISLIQMSLFLIFLPLTQIDIFQINFVLFFTASFIGSFGLAALGFVFAWGTGSSSAYHALMSVVLIPMWILSGAVFPMHAPWMQIVSQINPMSHLVILFRAAFENKSYLALLNTNLVFLICFSFMTLLIAIRVCYKRR